MARLLTNPVAQFLGAGLIVFALVVIGTVRLSQNAADHEAIAAARATTDLLGRSVAQPAIPRGLVDADPTAVATFDRTALRRLLVGDVRRIKIWRADGTIVYSDKVELIGNKFPLGDDEQRVLARGSTDAEISDLNAPENRYERGGGERLEVYSRMQSPEGDPLLFEAYFDSADIAKRRKQVYDAFGPIALGGLLVLVIGTTPLLWGLNRRLDRTRRDRERLLEAAADASETERRRIARDLHDGVVQDLAGTSFALSATMRDPLTAPDTARQLTPMAQSLRSSLRSLRSLLVEIYPPDLGAEGLNAAMQDLVAPAIGVGITTVVEVSDVDSTSDEAVRLVWRVAQEAVRNAIRHADARHLTVRVRAVGDRLHLDVADDGIGFETRNGHGPGQPDESGGLGLRSLRDLIREAGGTLDVRTSVGEGTTVHLEVNR